MWQWIMQCSSALSAAWPIFQLPGEKQCVAPQRLPIMANDRFSRLPSIHHHLACLYTVAYLHALVGCCSRIALRPCMLLVQTVGWGYSGPPPTR
jgi:hypothetical protein